MGYSIPSGATPGRSTHEVVDLLGSDASPASVTTSYSAGATSGGLDAGSASHVVLWVWIDVLQNAAQLDLQVEASPTGSATATEWTPLMTEAVSAGAATLSPYEPQRDVTGMSTDPTLALVLPVATRGIRYFRVKLKADSACTAHVQYQLS